MKNFFQIVQDMHDLKRENEVFAINQHRKIDLTSCLINPKLIVS